MIGEGLDEALDRLEAIRADALHAINTAVSTADLERLRILYLGKKSEINQILAQVMPRVDSGGKRRLGAEVNAAKQDVEGALSDRGEQLRRLEMEGRLEAERLDVTLPGTIWQQGYRHPLLQTIRDVLFILQQMGYDIYEGPEVEWEKYNFDMLNVPKWHPARDIQDTFWVTDEILLRTQTSPGQIRYMQSHRPPIRVASPGWCYRNEAEDASHADHFYQIEGLAVDVDITLADLKGTLSEVSHRFFGPERRIRIRPHYFPFTEPSAEIDIECAVCGGSGCRSCGNEGWLELGGCGMVHPNVLRWCGYDPEAVSGFAFGIGPNRYAMMKYGIPDMRLFRENDLRLLSQFD